MRGASGAPSAGASCCSVGKLVTFGHVPPAAGAARPLASPGLGSSASRPVSVTQAGAASATSGSCARVPVKGTQPRSTSSGAAPPARCSGVSTS